MPSPEVILARPESRASCEDLSWWKEDGMSAEWKDLGYNCYRMTVGGWALNVSWSVIRGEGFVVSFAGHKSKKSFKDLEPAKAYAVRFAHKRLSQALAELDGAGPTGT